MDKARDKEVSTINTILKGYAAMKNAALSEPATALRSVLDRYLKAKITAKSFNEETGLILSLLGEFDTEENKKNVKALPGVEEALEDLKKAHEDFISYHDAKLAAQRDKAPSASSAKEPLLQAINERLVPVLNAALIEETKELLNFAAVVSTEISNVNASIANREKAAKKAKTEAETKKEAQTEVK
jgi:hypothetical protein